MKSKQLDMQMVNVTYVDLNKAKTTPQKVRKFRMS